MPQDKQLRGITLDDVLQRRRLDQALNAKEFAVLAGVSYTTAREWFRLPGFPVIQGVVFWGDFVDWRRAQTGLAASAESPLQGSRAREGGALIKPRLNLPPRAAQILSETG
jgi:hypothetical protein